MGRAPAHYLPPRELWPTRIKLPREFAFLEKLPRAPGPGGPGTGKLLRRVLRQQEAGAAGRS